MRWVLDRPVKPGDDSRFEVLICRCALTRRRDGLWMGRATIAAGNRARRADLHNRANFGLRGSATRPMSRTITSRTIGRHPADFVDRSGAPKFDLNQSIGSLNSIDTKLLPAYNGVTVGDLLGLH